MTETICLQCSSRFEIDENVKSTEQVLYCKQCRSEAVTLKPMINLG
ncbi:MAG TPA: hypothetical protein VJZ32_03070 [Candidatus Bathyarchaeia archaeon]|nr:hypothetical protein [Candidatus Bathyarchaeia archaeon]